MSLLRNWFFYWAGLGVLVIVSLKHRFLGYSSPAPFDATDAARSEQHSRIILQSWADFITQAGFDFSLVGKDVLELGPGGTLAAGALILAKGAKSYCAGDAFALAAAIPPSFYGQVLRDLPADDREGILRAITGQETDRFHYLVVADFQFARALDGRRFDYVLSCAAFEHFDDVEDAIRQARQVLKPGGVFCALVDFQTHSAVLRERDPNNIYRYSRTLYQGLSFPGQPNRIRPTAYVDWLRAGGFVDVQVIPACSNTPEYMSWTKGHMDAAFAGERGQLDILNAAIVARLPD